MTIKFFSKKLILLFLFSNIYAQKSNSMQMNFFANNNNLHFLHKNKNGLYAPGAIKNNFVFSHSIKRFDNKWVNMKILWKINEDTIDLYEFSNLSNLRKGQVKIGSFNPEKLYDENMLSSGSMVFSNNSKKIMGISLNSNWYNFLDIFNYKAELFHGKFPKQRGYSGGPYLHYKSMLFKKQFLESTLGFSVKHAVQYGGYDFNNEKIPASWGNYIDVFFSRRGDESQPEQDQVYRAGNGLGSFVIFFEKKSTQIYFEHYFDDKSGVKTMNFGDGLMGINVKTNKINLNFEVIDTRNQSGNKHPPGVDSYYYHGVYEFGWSNKGLTIGNSFIHPNSNRKFVYNIGIESIIDNFKLITRYAFSEVYIPYQDKNQNQPYENYRDIISTDNYIFFGINYEFKNRNIVSLNFSKENDLDNFQLSYLINF